VRRALYLLAAALLALGLGAGAPAAWIPAKAALAQVLLERAWREARAGTGAPTPWPWADTHPVARLVAPRQDVARVVLAGASGSTLAFAPGHLHGSAPPGTPGTSVVAGHRDTHFAFLRRVARGDPLVVETPDGRRHRYRVAERAVVHERDADAVVAGGGADHRLVLVTCWPFDALRPGGPWRLVVVAHRAAGAAPGVAESPRRPDAGPLPGRSTRTRRDARRAARGLRVPRCAARPRRPRAAPRGWRRARPRAHPPRTTCPGAARP